MATHRRNKGDGTFFRRKKGKYIPIDADANAIIYYSVRSESERITFSCHTAHLPTAEHLVKKHLSSLDTSSDDRLLESLIKAGEKARRQLTRKKSGPQNPPSNSQHHDFYL